MCQNKYKKIEDAYYSGWFHIFILQLKAVMKEILIFTSH